MQYKISTSISTLCKVMSLTDSMNMAKAAGFDSVDFPFSVYSADPGTPLLGSDWRQWVRELAKLSNDIGLPITQAHANWVQAIPDDFHYVRPMEVYYRTIEACATVGCGQLVFHPLRQPDRVDSLSMRQRIHDYNVRWFHDLVASAEQFGVVINPENTFDSHLVQKAGDLPYPYTTAQDMLALVHDVGSRWIQVCLDTGHANISCQDVPAMIRCFRGDLATLHLNDNYGPIGSIYPDLHLFPGYGRLDWTEIFSALQEIGFRGVINIEPIGELKRINSALRLIQLRAAADSLRAML